MEASRLVFVSLKGAKPRRKVAVPVPDSYTYEQFADKVKLKLKLLSVGSIYHASTGDKLTSIDELQDIDELLVEEAPAQAPLTASAYADGQGNSVGESTEIHIGAPDRASSSMGAASAAMLRGSQPSRVVGGVENGGDDDEDVQKKYKKRNTGAALLTSCCACAQHTHTHSLSLFLLCLSPVVGSPSAISPG